MQVGSYRKAIELGSFAPYATAMGYLDSQWSLAAGLLKNDLRSVATSDRETEAPFARRVGRLRSHIARLCMMTSFIMHKIGLQ